MANQALVSAAPDRRDRFRSFMKRFNPSAPAKSIIDQGLVCRDEGSSIARKLVAGIDLAPGSQQLIVGGIGSGKTTELLLAERTLAATPQMLPVYVDVSSYTDLTAVTSGTLLASLGLRAWTELETRADTVSAKLRDASKTVNRAAYGYVTHLATDPFSSLAGKMPDLDKWWRQGFDSVSIPGKLKPPSSPLRSELQEGLTDLAEAVTQILSALRGEDTELVVIFDGLDRLIKPDQFWSVTEQDLRALKIQNISVLIAGPLSVMYGHGRTIADYFDQIHYIAPAIADPKVSPLLLNILSKRKVEDFIEDLNEVYRLCLASGGVLRDLISLARSAGENAYLDDSDRVQPPHVDKAIEQLGTSYLLGLGTEQIQILNAVLRDGGVSPSDPLTMELLITRRILERSGSTYEVHPALAQILPPGSGDLN